MANTREVFDQDETPMFGVGLHNRGTGFCQPTTRYEQGRWMARFGLKLLWAVVCIIGIALMVMAVMAL